MKPFMPTSHTMRSSIHRAARSVRAGCRSQSTKPGSANSHVEVGKPGASPSTTATKAKQQESISLGPLFVGGLALGGAGYGYYYYTQQQEKASQRAKIAKQTAAAPVHASSTESATNAYLAVAHSTDANVESGTAEATAEDVAAAGLDTTSAPQQDEGAQAQGNPATDEAPEAVISTDTPVIEDSAAPAISSAPATVDDAQAAALEQDAASLAGQLLAAEASEAEASKAQAPAAEAKASSAPAGTSSAPAVSEEPIPFDLKAAVEAARAHSNQWLAEQMAVLLRADLDRDAASEVSVLSPAELREKVLRLSHELANRGKFEALALKTLVEENDKLWMAKVRTIRALGVVFT